MTNNDTYFFEGGSEGAKHVNMDDPYCANLRKHYLKQQRDMMFSLKGMLFISAPKDPF
ncbi:MAG: hypothetical protein Ct9H300mP21_10200 [Pseudomonadota bacterium]|nr:MAG: hypothetical protein Ct9H300mP21_10200 [Pseudomonadota bacterium]